MPIIETRELRKVFRSLKRHSGRRRARCERSSRATTSTRSRSTGVTMSLEAGELVGYIGPNGAGKSTTIKMLTGILVPTSGDVARRRARALRAAQRERAQHRRRVRPALAALLGFAAASNRSSCCARSMRVPRDRYRANMDYFIELLELDEFLTTPVRQLSLGQRMRGDFAAAMLHDPQIVFLDEPTIGLDVVAKEAIRDVHRRHQQRARNDVHPHDARPGRRRAPVPADRADRRRHADLRRRDRAAARRSTARTARWS